MTCPVAQDLYNNNTQLANNNQRTTKNDDSNPSAINELPTFVACSNLITDAKTIDKV
mgnify:CR=1 FL=1